MVALGLQLRDHHDRKDDLVLGEAHHRARVGQQDGGVEHVRAGHGGSLRRLSAALAAPRRLDAVRGGPGRPAEGPGSGPPPGADAPWAGLPWGDGTSSDVFGRYAGPRAPPACDTHRQRKFTRVAAGGPTDTVGAGLGAATRASAPEAPFPRGVRAQRPQEVHPPEVRPVGLAEVEPVSYT